MGGKPKNYDTIHTQLIRKTMLTVFSTSNRKLPWHESPSPYSVWVSEIMLQQTRVATVIDYFTRWMQRFPTIADLAQASTDQVLSMWSGLGYYTRARNLHKGAQYLQQYHQGTLPSEEVTLRDIPGIGQYTAAAIASIAFNKPTAVVDANVLRIVARLYGIASHIRLTQTQKQISTIANQLICTNAPGDFNQGLMEFGQTICTPLSPKCSLCPLRNICIAKGKGLQTTLPVRTKPKAKSPVIEEHCLYICRGKDVLFARRNSSGLYANMWQLPSAPTKEHLLHLFVKPVAKKSYAQLVIEEDPICRHKQTLSHRELNMVIYRANFNDTTPDHIELKKDSPFTNIAWKKNVQDFGISSATRTILRKIHTLL